MSLNLKTETETERVVDALQRAGVDFAAGGLSVASRAVDMSPAAGGASPRNETREEP